MAIIRPTEVLTVQAAAAVISSVVGLNTKTVPRWVLALEIGEAIDYLAPKDISGDLLPINSWVLTTNSWIPSKVKTASNLTPTPDNFTPGFDDWNNANGGGDRALNTDYKIIVSGSLKIWQLVQYQQGDDDSNSEVNAMIERQLVIDKFSAAPRLGMSCADFEHDELKFAATNAVIPFNNSLIHVAQGNLPFSFSYVVSAT